jgi:hypothetical protein
MQLRLGRLGVYLAGALFAATIVSGCGGSSSDDSAEGSINRPSEPGIELPLALVSLSRTQYLAQANALCRRSWADMLTKFARRRNDFKGNEAQLFAFYSRNSFLPHMQFWFDDIVYLGAPEGEPEPYEGALEALQAAVYEGQERRISSPAQFAAIFADFNRRARKAGLDECLVEADSFPVDGSSS